MLDEPTAASDLSQAELLDRECRTWAMLCHLSALLQFFLPTLGNVIGPVIVWALKRDDHPFIDANGKESVNFQLSMTLYLWASGLLFILTVYFCIGFLFVPVILILGVLDIVLLIIAAIKAYDGVLYRYPLTIRFIR